MRRSALVLILLALALAPSARLAAQPTFTRIIVQDSVPLDLAPRDATLAAVGDAFVARQWLTPAARQRLAAGLGHDNLAALDPLAPGPVILSTNRFLGIPGDRRLRVELSDGTGLQVLGVGADAEESTLAAAGEPMPRGVLIGPDPGAEPPAGWRRIGPPDARPVVWTRALWVFGDRMEGAQRTFGIQDGGPTEPVPGADPSPDMTAFYQGLWKGDGPYPQHLQGIATDPEWNVYWSWTDRIVKTDARGEALTRVEAPIHHGDLCWHDDRVVVAVNLGKFNDLDEGHDSWAYVYDAESLELVAKHRLPEVRFGAGGVCWAQDRYVVVGGLPLELEGVPHAANEVHEYDAQFRHLRTVRLPGGWTRLGIQTAEFAYGRFFFGCYGEPRCALVASPDLRHVRRADGVDCAYGVARGPDGTVLYATDERGEDDRHRGRIQVANPWAFQSR